MTRGSRKWPSACRTLSGGDVVTQPLLIDGQTPPRELVDVVVDRFEGQCDEHVSEVYQGGSAHATTW